MLVHDDMLNEYEQDGMGSIVLTIPILLTRRTHARACSSEEWGDEPAVVGSDGGYREVKEESTALTHCVLTLVADVP